MTRHIVIDIEHERADCVPQPATRKIDVVETLHGVSVTDPYHRWLETNGEPEVQTWLAEQAAYAEEYFKALPVRQTLHDELAKLFSLDTVGLPVLRQGRYFFTERKGHQDMAVLYVQEGLDGTPRVLVDPNTLSQDKTITLQQWSPSRDGRLLAYQLSKAGNDRADIRVMDIDAGQDLADYIPDDIYPAVYSPITWNADGSEFWYTKRAPEVPASGEKFFQRMYFHALGTDWQHDPLVFGENLGKEDIPRLELSKDSRWLLATAWRFTGGKESAELWVKDMNNLAGEFSAVMPHVAGTRAIGKIHRGDVYILTNYWAPH